MKFIVKIALIVTLVLSSSYLFNDLAINRMKTESDVEFKRTAILWENDVQSYSFILVGDSVFCSYYVDDINETIWGKFEKYSGKPVLSGALNGARIADIYDVTKYLSKNLKSGSTVYLNIIPNRFASHPYNYVQSRNYEKELSVLNGLKGNPLDFFRAKIKIHYPQYIKIKIKKLKNKFFNDSRKHSPFFNRIWDVDGKFALKRFDEFLKKNLNFKISKDIQYLSKIKEELQNNGINTVFVLTPLNNELIETYAVGDSRKEILEGLDFLKEQLVLYLNKINADYIDLYSAVPSECFSDLMHTNTCGDDIIAKALAAYMKK